MISNSKLHVLKFGGALCAVFSFATACDDSDDDLGAGGRSGSAGAGKGGAQAGRAGSAGAGRGGASAGSAGSGTAGKGGAGGGRAGASGTGGAGAGGSAGKAGSTNGGTPSGGDAGDDGQTAGAGGQGADGGQAGASGQAGAAPTGPVELGSAENFAILAKSGVSTVPTSAVSGNVGVSPVAATAITGFSLTLDASDEFSISPQVTGMVYAADYATPTPSNLTTAVGDMELAFTDAAGRAADATELGAGDIGGMTLAPGVYRWGTGLAIPTDLTLNGDGSAVWIFQIAQGLTVSSAASVVLTGGAVPEHVFWQVSGAVELGTTAHFEGIILTQTSITLGTGASINGRLLAQTAVTLDANSVIEPGD
jgi:hypothetical protein